MIALLLLVLFVPMERYRPACDSWRKTRFEGPMREAYLGQLTEVLTEEAFGHIRIGDAVFVRFVYPFHYFSDPPTWFSLREFLSNTEWRIAANIADGYGPGGSRIQPPPVLVDLVEKHRAFMSRKFPETDWAHSGYSSGLFYHNCRLIRAAAIRIEDMRPEDLPDLSD